MSISRIVLLCFSLLSSPAFAAGFTCEGANGPDATIFNANFPSAAERTFRHGEVTFPAVKEGTYEGEGEFSLEVQASRNDFVSTRYVLKSPSATYKVEVVSFISVRFDRLSTSLNFSAHVEASDGSAPKVDPAEHNAFCTISLFE